ncbi:plasmid mobilization protein [Mucilaginibacter sp. X5P1]|uniref:plasmid mobilization protein n=1 Tax=Mucilaginibacter sp. X5P1 TaxID=2723088 RepID=UPI0016180959|nr:plasmid mobilization relaxosome protein MobC [Mucilaginibacter sp. X5P1]MBB6141682.1 hypothetical protein [Mucilaginibacter sp. X5P1]
MSASKKATGRPLLTEGRRIKKIDARFTEEEYKIIQALENELGIRKTDLVRTRLLQNAPAILINAKEAILSLDAIGAELGRSGNNINQLAKYANILQNKGALSPVVIERFNMLFDAYLENQKCLEATLRKVIRVLGR